MAPMKNKECSESENVSFDVEVSHTDIDAFWTFKGQPLKAGPKYKMESKNKRHTLMVLNAMKDEEGQYAFAAGEKTCSAMLTVAGGRGFCSVTTDWGSTSSQSPNLFSHGS